MRRFYRTASSLKVGIALLIIITLASLVGVIIPQGLESERYIAQWGTVAGSMLLSVGFDRLFSTPWYTVLLALFALNTLFCTINRIRGTVNAIAGSRFLSADQILAGQIQHI